MDTAARGELHGTPGDGQRRRRVVCILRKSRQDVSFYLLQAGAKSSRTSRRRRWLLALP